MYLELQNGPQTVARQRKYFIMDQRLTLLKSRIYAQSSLNCELKFVTSRITVHKYSCAQSLFFVPRPTSAIFSESVVPGFFSVEAVAYRMA